MTQSPCGSAATGRSKLGQSSVNESSTEEDVRVDCRVLGPVEVLDGGSVLTLGGSKPRLIVALLLAARGQVVPIDRLVDALWGPRPPPTAVPTLQTHVSRLRRLFTMGSDLPRIETHPPGYRLDVAASGLDAARFEAGVGRARHELDRDPRAALSTAEATLGEWRGPAFAEFAGEDCLQAEAARLEELRVVAHEVIVDARLACGEHRDVIGLLEVLVADHPLRERLWAQLMLALFRSGRPGEALRRSAELRGLLRDELGLSPSAEVRALEGDILAERPELTWAAPAPDPGPKSAVPLPRDPASLVGRDGELEVVRGLVADTRLVTVTGSGGVGKTRLVQELLEEFSASFSDGIRWVELAPVRGGDPAVAAVATALELQRRPERSLEDSIVDVLAPLSLLLVLDNCEHVLEGVAPLVARILRRCPTVRVLATSREPLGLPGEATWTLPPLDVPSSGAAGLAEVSASTAVALFTARAAAARPGFVLDESSRRTVAAICIRLDGIPLALELAAARVRSMTLADVADRLDARFGLLATARAADPRHRTLLDVVRWSHDLLTPAEQMLFARVCVFAGSFDLARAEDVCASQDDLAPSDVAALLAALVDKSMVVATESGGRMRYRLLETLREFARARLRERPEAAATGRAHARSHLRSAREAGEGLDGPDEQHWSQRIEEDLEDLREAFGVSVRLGDLDTALELVTAIREFAFRSIRYEILDWAATITAVPGAQARPLFPVALAMVAYGRFVRGEVTGASVAARNAIEAAERLDAPTLALAERVMGNVLFYRGETTESLRWMDRMLEVARASGEDGLLAHGCYMRSVAQISVDDQDGAEVLAAEAHRVAQRCASPTALAKAAYAVGLTLKRDDPERALDLLAMSGELAGAVDNRWLRAFARTEELYLRAQQGDLRGALEGYREVVDTWFRGGEWANQWLSLRHLFGVFASLGDDEIAAVLHGAVDSAGATFALPFDPLGASREAELAEAVRARQGEPAYDAAVSRGRSMRDEEVIRMTLAHLDETTRPR
jgi:predicted ATPase/DNA-binding SARP family transcriptional activator